MGWVNGRVWKRVRVWVSGWGFMEKDRSERVEEEWG